VEWDRLRIDQAITNLLTNALKYGDRQPVELRIESVGELVRVSVQDRGIGIAPEDLERIFGRFERAVSSRKISGLGLGLYITRQIVEAHGGQIRVESRLGEGSRFTLELPAVARLSEETGFPLPAISLARSDRSPVS
jgi:signal transduction histidine kinase